MTTPNWHPKIVVVVLMLATLCCCSTDVASKRDEKCSRIYSYSLDCWLKYHLPMCKGKNPVTECAESKYTPSEIYSCEEAAQLYKGVGVQYSLYCTNNLFKSEFHDRVPCWISTRRCTIALAAAAAADLNKTAPNDQLACGRLIHEARECNEYAPCRALHLHFTAALAERSGCAQSPQDADALVHRYFESVKK